MTSHILLSFLPMSFSLQISFPFSFLFSIHTRFKDMFYYGRYLSFQFFHNIISLQTGLEPVTSRYTCFFSKRNSRVFYLLNYRSISGNIFIQNKKYSTYIKHSFFIWVTFPCSLSHSKQFFKIRLIKFSLM